MQQISTSFHVGIATGDLILRQRNALQGAAFKAHIRVQRLETARQVDVPEDDLLKWLRPAGTDDRSVRDLAGDPVEHDIREHGLLGYMWCIFRKSFASTRTFAMRMPRISGPREVFEYAATKLKAVRVSEMVTLEMTASWTLPSPTPGRIALQELDRLQSAIVT